MAQVVRALPNETEQKWVHVARCFSTTLADNTAHATETVVSGLCEEFLLEEDCTGGGGVNSVLVRSGKRGRGQEKALHQWFPKCTRRNPIAFPAVQRKP